MGSVSFRYNCKQQGEPLALGILTVTSRPSGRRQLNCIISLQHSSFLTSAQQTFYWRDFLDVTLQTSRQKGRKTSRLALEFPDGQVVPLRSYYTSNLKNHATTQAIMRAFRDKTTPDW